MTEDKHFPTANGSGVAIFDYDNDGKLDLYFATGTLLPLGHGRDAARTGSTGTWATARSRTSPRRRAWASPGFCHGIVVGDIDNDGDQDVFLCNYGPNVLYLNNGDGTFTDISKAAGIDQPDWSSGGAFLDYDNDGDLDLYVANYGDWKLPDDDRLLRQTTSRRTSGIYCSPKIDPDRPSTSSTATTATGPSPT